jgi:hypothetical protein
MHAAGMLATYREALAALSAPEAVAAADTAIVEQFAAFAKLLPVIP